jgi:hypothetical protein
MELISKIKHHQFQQKNADGQAADFAIAKPEIFAILKDPGAAIDGDNP